MIEMTFYKVSPNSLNLFCQELFGSFGVDEKAAQTVADNLVEAELRGVKSHGIARVKGYAENLATKQFNATPNIKILREDLSTLAVDGDFGLGAVTGTWTMKKCLEKAEKTGACFATVGRGRHFGMSAFYAMMALERDMIGITLCNSDYNMNVYGGTSRVLGTNPICIAVPANQRYPLVFDAATSKVAFNRIRNAALERKEIPIGWGLDREGNETTDAKEALIGGVVHFGSYKGSGLAVMVQVLSGILSSAFLSATKDSNGKVSNGVGFFFGAINISSFLDIDLFKQGIDDFIDHLKASRPDKKLDAIYMPGELEYLRKEKNLHHGVKISEAILQELLSVRKKYGIKAEFEAVLLTEDR
jgi:LDH2 family malate/lactate/ureidoglycolate dehydrogenase